jgi:hypothetical protein
MPTKKKDWPVIVAGTAFAAGLTLFFLFGLLLLPDSPPLLHVMKLVPAAAWLMALGCVMAMGIVVWRTVHFFRGADASAAEPQPAAKVPLLKPIVLIVTGIVLFVMGIYTENAEIGLLTVFGEFVLLIGVMLLVHRLESEN